MEQVDAFAPVCWGCMGSSTVLPLPGWVFFACEPPRGRYQREASGLAPAQEASGRLIYRLCLICGGTGRADHTKPVRRVVWCEVVKGKRRVLKGGLRAD
jgi:hypothetical protein